MKSYTTEAIIINRRNYSEADRILTSLTREKGKISARAKGVRKQTSKRKGSIELFSQIRAQIHDGKWVPILADIELVEAFLPTQIQVINANQLCEPTVQYQSNKLYIAYQCAEIIDKILPVDEPHLQIYELLQKTFHYLNTQNTPEINKLIRGFKLKVIQKLGYWPDNQPVPADIDHYLEQLMERPLVTSKVFNL